MMNSSRILDEVLADVARALLPPERIPLSDWSDRYRRLSSEGSVQPGGWTTFPFQKEPLDVIGPQSSHETVVLMWSSQMGKSEALLSSIAYSIKEDPGPILVVQPTLAMAEAFSKDRLAPMFRDMPILKGKVSDPKSRDAGSTIFHRRFIGGHVTIVGSNSPAGLASRPIRYLLMDEVDRWEESAGAEGDPATLAIARTRTFWNRKILLVSTPTVKGGSRIEAAFLESDQRYFHVPCDLCGYRQRLIWSRVEWPEGKPEEAAYRCCKCEKLIPHSRKNSMLKEGSWIATEPESRIAGFHLSELYSPWRSWAQLAEEWLKCQSNIERKRAFINTVLAELWDDEQEGRVTESELMARREAYGPVLPEKIAILTAGVDVQGDRIEVSVYGWTKDEESWLMNHRVIPGDPSTPHLWEKLDNFLAEGWRHPLMGTMPIHAVCIDSGHFTAKVCQFADERRGRRVWAIKGAQGSRPAWPRRQSKAQKGRVYIVGVDSLKATISHRLRYTEGPGSYHWPLSVDKHFFEQINSEYLITEYRRGRPERAWVRRKGRAAEAWDCAVYALAAVHGLASHGISVDVETAKMESLRQTGTVEPSGYRVKKSTFIG